MRVYLRRRVVGPNAWAINFETSQMFPITTSVADAAKAIGVGHTTLYSLIKDGRLKVVKIGRRTLIRVDSIHALLAGEEV